MAEGEGDESSVRWLISYADYMMQLVCLFILLYATSNPDIGKLKAIAEEYRKIKGLEKEPPRTPVRTHGPEEPATTTIQLTGQYIVIGGDPKSKYAPRIVGFNVDRGIKLEFENVEVFAEGKAELTSDAKELVIMARNGFRALPNKITITGHTANNSEDSSNSDKWLLSYMRAKAVADVFTDNSTGGGVNQSRISVEAKANFEPRQGEADPVKYEEARKANRRADILIEGLKSQNVEPPKQATQEEK